MQHALEQVDRSGHVGIVTCRSSRFLIEERTAWPCPALAQSRSIWRRRLPRAFGRHPRSSIDRPSSRATLPQPADAAAVILERPIGGQQQVIALRRRDPRQFKTDPARRSRDQSEFVRHSHAPVSPGIGDIRTTLAKTKKFPALCGHREDAPRLLLASPEARPYRLNRTIKQQDRPLCSVSRARRTMSRPMI